jgi:hypothetical protein
MKNIQILAGIVVIALLFSIGPVTALTDNSTGSPGSDGVSDIIDPYNGPIGADSPLYNLKIAMENLDETFTFNDSQRVEKQIGHGKVRIAEVQQALQLNRPEIAERALNQYKQKLNMTEVSLVPFSKNTTGLLHAQEMITQDQDVLASLVLKYPNNTGLNRAYDNSRSLEQKFEVKTEMRFNRSIEKDNRTVYKPVRLQIQNQNNNNNDNNTNDVKNAKQEKITIQKDVKGGNMTAYGQTIDTNGTPSAGFHGNDSKPSQDQGKRGRD